MSELKHMSVNKCVCIDVRVHGYVCVCVRVQISVFVRTFSRTSRPSICGFSFVCIHACVRVFVYKNVNM